MITVDRNMLPITKTSNYLVVSTVLSVLTCINTRIFIAVKTYFWVKEKLCFHYGRCAGFLCNEISGRTEEANRKINKVIRKLQQY
jgi:hypothetical protein